MSTILRSIGDGAAGSLHNGTSENACNIDISAHVFVEIVDALQKVQTIEDFSLLMRTTIRQLLPHSGFAGGLGLLDKTLLGVEPIFLITHRFPVEHIHSTRGPSGNYNSPVIRHWLAHQSPIHIDFRARSNQWPPSVALNADRLGFTNLFAHGQLDASGKIISYFSFHNLPEARAAAYILLLNRLLPFIHCVTTRLYLSRSQLTIDSMIEREPGATPSTSRRDEILQWVRAGKTNWEIARIVGITEHTVKYHLRVLMQQFNVSTRTALALSAAHGKRPPTSINFSKRAIAEFHPEWR